LNVFIRFKCALRHLKCFIRLKGALDVWEKGEVSVSHTQTLVVLLTHPLYAQAIREESISYPVIWPPSEHPFTVFRYGGVSLWCFSLADLIVGVQTAARAPLCPLLFRYSQTEQNEGALAREDKPRTKTTLVNRREQLFISAVISNSRICIFFWMRGEGLGFTNAAITIAAFEIVIYKCGFGK